MLEKPLVPWLKGAQFVCPVSSIQLGSDVLISAICIAEKASLAIMDIYKTYQGDFSQKVDKSPLTAADTTAHRIIVEHLRNLCPGLPIISEEGEDFDIEENSLHFLVDPLDGTKEFIHRNGDFTVNIALILAGKPVFGVVIHPVSGVIYAAVHAQGAWRNTVKSDWERIGIAPSSGLQNEVTRIFKSRSHAKDETDHYLESILNKDSKVEILEVGSSLKFCKVAENPNSMYPRLAPTMEWDTAAGDIIVQEAGGSVTDVTNNMALIYGKKDRHNPSFIARGNLQKK